MSFRQDDLAAYPLIVEDAPESQVRVGRLDSLPEIRNELARLYRAARKNVGQDVDPQSATRLAFLLNCIGKSLEAVELEKRVSDLEDVLKGSK